MVSRRSFLETGALAAAAGLARRSSAQARPAAPCPLRPRPRRLHRRRQPGRPAPRRLRRRSPTSRSPPCATSTSRTCGGTPRPSTRASRRWAASPGCGRAVAASVPRERDFRRLLDRKDVDAVCIATPDHWHAVQTILALEAGKDVYVEKPLTITLVEGRRMVEAQKRTGRVVQVGLNRRASPVYQELAPLVRDGLIGKVTLARAYRVDNMAPARDRPGEAGGPAARLRLGPVARAAGLPAVPVQHRALPLPLVEGLLVADGQLGRPLHGRDPLADRRAGPGGRLGPRRALRRGRRPHDPRHDGGDLRDAGRRPRRLRHLRGRRRQPDRRRRDRARGDEGHPRGERERAGPCARRAPASSRTGRRSSSRAR